jgi:hypothetical protein
VVFSLARLGYRIGDKQVFINAAASNSESACECVFVPA